MYAAIWLCRMRPLIAGSAEGKSLDLLAQLHGVFRQTLFERGCMYEVTALWRRSISSTFSSPMDARRRTMTTAFTAGSLLAANGIFRSRPGTFSFWLNWHQVSKYSPRSSSLVFIPCPRAKIRALGCRASDFICNASPIEESASRGASESWIGTATSAVLPMRPPGERVAPDNVRCP